MGSGKRKNDLVEIFGYSPDDASDECRTLWKLGGCQFTGRPCTKHNHDKTVTYGVCSVTTPYGDCIICPNRLYAQDFMTLRAVSEDAFGGTDFMMFPTYLERRPFSGRAVIAMGMHSGHEIGTKGFSMDWVLAEVSAGKLLSYTGAEVQSLDITGNYRDAWYAYKNISESSTIPKSGHGLNWANVHKRLIPQIIRKSLIYSKSPFVRSGLYFIVPEVVYVKFEDIIGKDIPLTEDKAPNIITVFTWELGASRGSGKVRKLLPKRKLRFSIEDFSERFISGPTLPSYEVLDRAVKQALGVD
jgi:Restriction endonuclease NotI.